MPSLVQNSHATKEEITIVPSAIEPKLAFQSSSVTLQSFVTYEIPAVHLGIVTEQHGDYRYVTVLRSDHQRGLFPLKRRLVKRNEIIAHTGAQSLPDCVYLLVHCTVTTD